MMASMCQPETNDGDGSTTCQARRTKSRRCRRACSRSISISRFGLASNCTKLFEFFIGQIGKVRFGGNLDWSAGQTGVLRVDDVAVTEQVLREEDGGSHVAAVRQAEQYSANRCSAFCPCSVHKFPEFRDLKAALQGPHADAEICGNLFVGALQLGEPFKFADVDLQLRPGHWSFLLLDQSPPARRSIYGLRSSRLLAYLRNSDGRKSSPCQAARSTLNVRSATRRSVNPWVRLRAQTSSPVPAAVLPSTSKKSSGESKKRSKRRSAPRIS